ncbi:right-handed parallel beta-helix repeat-containing protein [Bradyrhizobium sediminis]|uniref:Right-handed parallel beta-helix repeat-containing protein n=1 Tax=Bradyrhizobium sediminis TaxID=2840469 RepID=A0A975P1B4_9BRAD|nr:right-handed parallel beta-helix repeat-containing protein [Bradyrhizobium sediminis]QWG24805.1 right-handed parallel beta-helix repeat-containing protein [Bradyrhizobium sediminis]
MTAWTRSSTAQRTAIGTFAICSLSIAAAAAFVGVNSSSCLLGAIAVEPGNSIQAAVDLSGEGAVFCLKKGIHRAQVVRPRAGQRFDGEGETVLNGSWRIGGFRREGRYWVANSQLQRVPKHGECLPSAPACDQPQAVFIDDKPLTKVARKDALATNEVYIDYAGGRIYLVDDPTDHKVEATIATFAFESDAPDVLIGNLTVEKYGSVAQKGAIHAREGVRWTIENCVVRLNSGAGISVGTGTRVRNCDIHHNGQIGIEGDGKEILIEGNRIWSNNVYGFDPEWEAGGVKIAESSGVTFRGNHVHDNNGAGLWCDIGCRNVVYEDNLVENNQHVGIFHEISFNAVIRRNVVRHNGGGRSWFWHADIVVAASQDVEVIGNTVTAGSGACGIVLIDQGRRGEGGGLYKTRNNLVHANEMIFEGAPCAGGASDTKPKDENFAIIANGNNRFDANTYRVRSTSGPARFVWGHDVTDWDGFRRKGLEQSGRLVLYGE